ncbi:MAG TPA: hypothetical protein G4O15_06910 [Dehalococcoidia bacterium]|nr:hypothetical protein [Dehalococcoidia bacterium]
MDAGDILQMIFFGFLSYGIPVLFWIGTLIFGIVKLRRGGGKAERFFITGAALNILGTLLRIPIVYLPFRMSSRSSGIDTMRNITFGVGLAVDIVSAAGVICMIYAFWLKFKNKRVEQTVLAESES